MYQVSHWCLHWMHLDLAHSLSDSEAFQYITCEDQVLTPSQPYPQRHHQAPAICTLSIDYTGKAASSSVVQSCSELYHIHLLNSTGLVICFFSFLTKLPHPSTIPCTKYLFVSWPWYNRTSQSMSISMYGFCLSLDIIVLAWYCFHFTLQSCACFTYFEFTINTYL